MIEIRLILLGLQIGCLVAQLVAYWRGEVELGFKWMLAVFGVWFVSLAVKAFA